MNDTSPKRPRNRTVNFTFRSQPKLTTKHGTVLHYLNSEDGGVLPRRDRVMQALTAFWLPFAARFLGTYSKQELRSIALECIYQLELHIRHIEEVFGLVRQETKRSATLRGRVAGDDSTPEWEDEDDSDFGESEDSILSNWS